MRGKPLSTIGLGGPASFKGLRGATQALLAALKANQIHAAIGGSLALFIEGFDIGREPDDGDVVLLDDAPKAGQVLKALKAAGCRNMPSESSVKKWLRSGYAEIALGPHKLELQVPAAKAAKAPPHAKAAALQLLQHTRNSVAVVDGMRILRAQNVAVWKAIFAREKDKQDLRALIACTNAAGEPAITDGNELVAFTRAIKGVDAAAWLNKLLFEDERWFSNY